MHRRIRNATALAVVLSVAVLGATGAWAGMAQQIDIPYEKFALDNGLTVIVHEDHKAPIVAVNLWYHVGSKNEKTGRTGFAHLFEHLMFNGSENFDDDYFQVAERIGATDLNGTTNEDRTNYFQNVPVSALDTILWLESDRMGHLLGAVTQDKLDEQRGVVQNEKRQGENQPYAVAYDLITESTYPQGHPYAHTVIGSMEDLDAAKLDDVHKWFQTYYGPSNAVLVLAGDIDLATAKAKAEKYFGDIPSGPPVAHQEAWVAPRAGVQRQRVFDRVPHARVYQVWNVPREYEAEAQHLELLADVLTDGKTSRLYKRLVYDEQIARDVRAFLDSREIGSQFYIQATAQPGVDLARIEQVIAEELRRLLDGGPTEEELQRAKTGTFAGFVRGSERIGGFGGKSDILAASQVYGGSADAYKQRLQWIEAASLAEVRDAGRRWLSDGLYQLEVLPFPSYATADTGADRKALPEPGDPPESSFVATKRTKLSNGLEVVLAERHATPIVNLYLLVDAGYAADQFSMPGAATLAMNMLDEGTTRRDALAISDELVGLGATLGSGSNLDQSTVSMTALKANLDRSLDLFADVILNPAFPAKDFERLKKQQLTTIQAEKTQPMSMALRVFPALLYGKAHAYGNPFTGSGTEVSVTKLVRDDLVKFHQTWFKPNNATLVVVGDTSLAELQPKLESLFRGWKTGQVPSKNIAAVQRDTRPTMYIVDKPGAIQSVILAGHVAPPRGVPEEVAIQAMNDVLGGNFISRLNMNLREDKHWSYGARTMLVDAKGQRPFIAFAPVQTDKTKESVQEILKEMRGIRGERPITADELAKVKEQKILELPGSWETNDAVASAITEIVRFDLAEDYFDKYPREVAALQAQALSDAARDVVHDDNLVWVVVGDREKIEAGLRELNIGEIKLMDADGNLLR